MRAVKAEVLSSLDALENTHQFQIIFYNETPKVFNPTGQPGRLAFGTPQNKAAAEQFVNSLIADGGTRHDDAIALALRMRPDAVFLFTDADDPKLGPYELGRIDRLAGGTPIHTIEFGSGPQPQSDSFLLKLARQSGGKYRYIDITRTPVRPVEVPEE